MSAIAGYWHQEGGQDAGADCARMLNALALYGPEDEAQRADGEIAVGKRYLRLLPEDASDRRPVTGGEGRFLLVADIRLDNRPELGDELGLTPAQLGGLSDSAVAMRAIERWGEEAIARLVGDFALAWWDAGARRLLLARDFLGQRPLHYHRGGGFFAFASMAKGLHALAQVPYAADAGAAAQFLALLPERGTRTFFEGIERVEPGHVVTVERGSLVSRPYWTPSLEPLRLERSEDYAELLRERFDRAVSDRLRGANRVAAHLSAGFDSAAVAATAARLLGPRGEVTGFTAVPRAGAALAASPGSIADEGPLAGATAALYPNLRHVRVDTAGRTPLDGMDRAFLLAERPTLNLCNAAWIDAILDAARSERLSVLLVGQFGNMTISHSGLSLLPRLLARGRLLRLASEAAGLVRRGIGWRTVAAWTAGPWIPRPIWQAIGRRRGRLAGLGDYSAIHPDRIAEMEALAAGRALDTSYRPRRDGAGGRLWVLQRADPGCGNKAVLAGWGIDQRDPTADRRLVELSLRIPDEQWLVRGDQRALARRAWSDRLPAQVLAERRRGYQAADWPAGLAAGKERLEEELGALRHLPVAGGTLDLDGLDAALREWPEDWTDERTMRRYRLALLRGVSAGHFLRKASGSNR